MTTAAADESNGRDAVPMAASISDGTAAPSPAKPTTKADAAPSDIPRS
ncbi:MAG: hypothetical protein IPH38_20910 [Candidatus Microthrix sp.]|nr:hypothetical protein [Candidatus Microthrix sp.]MBK7021962.1 hypothetical protein [Candidatus Microthrix sp.]